MDVLTWGADPMFTYLSGWVVTGVAVGLFYVLLTLMYGGRRP